jgi:hypothetical protein
MNNIHITKLVDDYASLSAQMKVLTDLIVTAKAKLLLLGDGCYEGTTRKVIISTAIPIKFDAVALKAARPEIHQEFTLPGTPVTSVRVYNR